MEGLFVYGLGHVIVKIALIIQSNCRTQYLLAVSLNVASWQVDVAFCFLELAITGPSLTYPAFASNWNIGFALTARHFCQTATKVPKKALPHRTASRRAVDQEPPRRPTGRPDWRQYVYLSKICFAFAFAFVMRLFRRRESPSQKAERRCCYGGGAAGRRASRDGPWMARRGVPP